MSGTDWYILRRKARAKALSLLFLIMRIFPIKRAKVVFSAFEGDGAFCCNPRYIAEELHRRAPGLKLVWLTKKKGAEFPDYIRVKRYNALSLAYHLATAKVWVDNYRKPYGTLKRKGQFYLQTWHASMGFKAVGLFRGSLFPEIARIVSEADSALVDCLTSNSEYCNRVYPKKLLYLGPTLMSGSPRVDPLLNKTNGAVTEVRRRLGIKDGVKLLMFAPTFRGGNQKGRKRVISSVPSVDFGRLFTSLDKRFGGSWNALLRLHPQLSAKLDRMPLDKADGRLVDVSGEPDMSELLACCDFLITAYSSCAFDAAFAGIPVLLYADDVQSYIEDRGQFMWRRDELPFDIAEDNDELEANVMGFSADRYRARVAAFMDRHGVLEDGRASARIAEAIEGFMKR